MNIASVYKEHARDTSLCPGKQFGFFVKTVIATIALCLEVMYYLFFMCFM